jgi:hypothetical protein
MCQATVISNTVKRLGRRSYTHRMDVATPGGYHEAQLSRLNRELDSLYEQIYEDWNTITEQDYAVFGGQLSLLVGTLKLLYDDCRRSSLHNVMHNEVERLGMNYSALYELNSDIVNFRIKAPHNTELQSMMSQASKVMNR